MITTATSINNNLIFVSAALQIILLQFHKINALIIPHDMHHTGSLIHYFKTLPCNE